MQELLITSPLTAALLAYLLPCFMSALTALIAWQGYRRLSEPMLRDSMRVLALVAAIQGALLVASSRGQAIGPPLLRALECVSLIAIGWAFSGAQRNVFLISALAACGAWGAFTLSFWQLTGHEPAWTVPAWWLMTTVIAGAAGFSLWLRQSENPFMLTIALAVLTLSYLLGALGRADGAVILRPMAFALLMIALTQISTRELDSVQSELALFSEHSLRQTQQLLTLLQTSTALIGQSDVKDILKEAVEGIVMGVEADRAFAALLDDTGSNTLQIQAVYPPGPGLNQRTFSLSTQPAIAEALRLDQTLVLELTHRGIHALAALVGTNAGPTIIQPLVSHERALGVIVAMNRRQGHEFTASDRRVMEAFGAQVASLIENALLDGVIETQTRELATLLAMQEEEANRQKAILESIADGVIVFDHALRASAANPAIHDILGLHQSEVIGRPMPDILNDHIHPDDYALVRSIIEGQQTLMSGLKIQWDNRTVSISVAPVKLPSKRHGTVMVLHDITADARVEQLKSEFVSVVSHELRSPFAMLDSTMQVIERHGLDGWQPPQRQEWQQLGQQLKRAETMVKNLVTFASFLSKQGQLRLVVFDLGEAAREAILGLTPMAQARNITLTCEADSEMPLLGDRERLSEATYHLIHNAIKFNRSGGCVVVSCRSLPSGLIIEVADTGVGIPPNRLVEVWQDFRQLADPLRRGMEGLGLGLPLVKYVVEAHGGQVWADSQVGRGSVFGFSLPRADIQ
jgi:two-component system phosphate regulon sensor histidine kinase PhoR